MEGRTSRWQFALGAGLIVFGLLTGGVYAYNSSVNNQTSTASSSPTASSKTIAKSATPTVAPVTTTTLAPVTTTSASTASTKSPALTGKININTATEAQLDELPGIGPTKAKDIAIYRAQHGLFKTVNDLDKVKGIGPATIKKLTPLITL